MNVLVAKLSRFPRRILADVKIVAIVRNWPALLKAKWTQQPIQRIAFRNGVVLESPPAMDLNFLFHEIWMDRTYTPAGYTVAEGDVVIDIGGNIGVFATYAATRAGNVSVYAFEPFPASAAFLRSNVEKSGLKNVHVETAAVAATAEPRRMNVASSWGCNSLIDGLGWDTMETIDVACTTLDRIIARTGRCDLIKLDCEGGEHEIFGTAARDTTDRIHRVVLEYHNAEHGTGGSLKRFLEHRGFRVDVFRAFDARVGVLCATNTRYRKS